MIGESDMMAANNMIANGVIGFEEIMNLPSSNASNNNQQYIQWHKSKNDDFTNIRKKVSDKYGESFDFLILAQIINNNFYDLDNIKSIYDVKENSLKNLNLVGDDIDIFIKLYRKEFENYDGEISDTKKEYKFRNLFSFYNNLLLHPNMKTLLDKNPDDFSWLLSILIKIDRAQYLIFGNLKVDRILKSMSDIQCAEFYYNVTSISNLPTFLKIDKMIDVNIKKYIFDTSKSILSGASRNSDLRILKHVIKNINNYYSDELHLKSCINSVISGCFSSNIPIKFTMKRLRLINDHISLSPYFEIMIGYIQNFDTMIRLNKYYGNEKNFGNDNTYFKITNLIFNFNFNFGFGDMSLVDNIYLRRINETVNIFNKLEHKSKMAMCIFNRTFMFWGLDFQLFLSNCPFNVIKNTVEQMLDKMNRENIFLNSDIFKLLGLLDRSTLTDCVNDYIIKNFNQFINNNINKSFLVRIFPFTKYFECSNIKIKNKLLKDIEDFNKGNNKISPNKINSMKKSIEKFSVKEIKYFISMNKLKICLIRYVRKFKRLLRLTKKLDKMNETSIEDNFNNNIDRKTNNISYKYFSKVPPRHFMINELDFYKNKEAIIREKADGYLVDCFPNDIEPSYEELFKNNMYSLKAEFIEELDLYLVFDIDIDSSEEERYKFLRNSHEFTRELIPNLDHNYLIDSFGILSHYIHEEKKNFEKFLERPYTSYRWYPKAAWKILLNKSFINALNGVCKIDYPGCNNGKINYDGYILSILDSKRELKIKPLVHQTIDLVYKSDKSFYDRDNYCWDDIINFDTSKLKKKGITLMSGKIYRLSPNLKSPLEFIIDSNRFDKKKANSNKIVNSVINFINYNMNRYDSNESLLESKFYYPKVDFSNSIYEKSEYWKKLVEKQNLNLSDYLKKLIPEQNKNWLDLGCGSLKLIKYINRFKYKGYMGIDNDYDQLMLGLNRIDQNILKSSKKLSKFDESRVRIVHGDLKDISKSIDYSWDTLGKSNKLISEGFDYIVSNFSISHFICDKFWEDLSKFSKPGTKFLFNCLNEKIISSPWSNISNGKESYIKYFDGFVKIKFEIHDEEVTEEYLPSTRIDNYLEKFGWKIVFKSKPSGDDLDSYYNWYIVSLI